MRAFHVLKLVGEMAFWEIEIGNGLPMPWLNPDLARKSKQIDMTQNHLMKRKTISATKAGPDRYRAF